MPLVAKLSYSGERWVGPTSAGIFLAGSVAWCLAWPSLLAEIALAALLASQELRAWRMRRQCAAWRATVEDQLARTIALALERANPSDLDLRIDKKDLPSTILNEAVEDIA